jgi:hypothetical protein
MNWTALSRASANHFLFSPATMAFILLPPWQF